MRNSKIDRALYDDLQIRFDNLQSKYHELVGEMLKRNPPPSEHFDIDYADSADENFPVPDKVLTAIHTYSEPGSQEANTVQETTFGLLRGGMSEEDVISAVHAGEGVDS